jgi:hypothetical protein
MDKNKQSLFGKARAQLGSFQVMLASLPMPPVVEEKGRRQQHNHMANRSQKPK